jgi:ketosteroid isomerase-like protein
VINTIDSLGAEADMAFLDYYEDEAIWMRPWDFQDNGKEDAYHFYKTLLEERPEIFKDNTREIHEITVCGDYAFVRGTWRRPAGIDSDGIARRGRRRQIIILRKQPDDYWKVHRDIYNNPDPEE